MSFPEQPDYIGDEDNDDAIPTKIDDLLEGEDEDEDAEALGLDEIEQYKTISSPTKIFAFFAFFVVLPVGAYVYFYKGGREKVREWRESRGYAKVGAGRV
jgi:hypothetical protein